MKRRNWKRKLLHCRQNQQTEFDEENRHGSPLYLEWEDYMELNALMERRARMNQKFGKELFGAVEIFEDVVNYDIEDELKLYHLQTAIEKADGEEQEQLVKDFYNLYTSMKPKENPLERIYLWPEGNMPRNTEYTDNSDYKRKHNPDFRPYMYALTVDKSVQPKGAVVVVAGGDHGRCVIPEAYQTCLDLNALGYQCFLLLNRVNHNPWSGEECGADTARAIRIIRANAEQYRISPDRVGYAGFSNGGLTGDNCIRYFSGTQTVKDHFPDYIPDDLDAYSGAPDAYCCIYGPRFQMDLLNPEKEDIVDYAKAIYPPTFIAVGREDFAMKNLYHYLNELVEHNIPVEVHTFAGVPHGIAGFKILNGGVEQYPNFNLWLPLADAFMQDAWKNR